MTPERFEDVEKRTRLVEEAIIEFKHIAKTVVVEHASRITNVENDIDDLKTSLYQSCDIKSKEIDDKIGNAIINANENTDKLFKQAIGISAGMFILFIGALVYLVSDTKILQSSSASHATSIEYIQHSLDKILVKMDTLSDNIATYQISDRKVMND